jgi:hypothetical protein
MTLDSRREAARLWRSAGRRAARTAQKHQRIRFPANRNRCDLAEMRPATRDTRPAATRAATDGAERGCEHTKRIVHHSIGTREVEPRPTRARVRSEAGHVSYGRSAAARSGTRPRRCEPVRAASPNTSTNGLPQRRRRNASTLSAAPMAASVATQRPPRYWPSLFAMESNSCLQSE